MHELITRFPDVEVFLSLEPEELAGHLLEFLRPRSQNGNLHRHNLANEFRHGGHHGQYPAERMQEVERAFMEAFVWLQSNGLLIPQPGNESWSILSRRAHTIADPAAFREFAAAKHFPKALLHPAIQEDVWRSFIRGEFATAVFQAMRAVEIAVREAAGYPEAKTGVPMVRDAFNRVNGPLSDMETGEAEREALASLFAGAIGSYKNPHSHRNVPLDDAGEATEMIVLASHLLRIVDARRPADAGAGAAVA